MTDKFIDNEITNSFEEALKKRISTPIYGTFLISWLIFHWNFVFTIFFVSEEKIWQANGILKNDYLIKTFFNLSDWHFYLWWFLPFVSTWLIIWYFPSWVSLPAFKKEEEYRLEMKRIRIATERQIENEKRRLEQVNLNRLKVIGEKTQKEKEIKREDPSIGWKEEYELFKKIPAYRRFNMLIESIYQHGGSISWINDNSLLAYSHANGLVNFSDNDNRFIKLTEKGKFFVNQFLVNTKMNY